jgi:MFS family permease
VNVPTSIAEEYQSQPRDFRYFLTTRFLGTVAIQIQVVGVGWQIYGITNDPVSLGIVALIEFLPMLILALPAGDMADRVDRRLVIIITRLVESCGSIALLALTLMGSQEVWHFYMVVLLFGLTRGISTPTLQSSLPFLVSTKQLPSAIALTSSVGTIGNVSGPAIGGFLFAAGPTLTYSTCFVLFVLAAFTALQMRIRRPVQMPSRDRAYQRIADGLKFIWKRQIIFGAITLDLFAVLVGGAVALLPVYARDILEVGPSGLGLLRSAPAFGAAIVGLFLARWPFDRYAGNCMFGFVAIFGLATHFYLSLAALAIVGGSDMFSVYIRSSLVQLATPDHMRGRVGSVNSLFVSASNELGQFRAGLMAGWIGSVPAVIFGGVGALVVVGVFALLFPALRKIDRISEVEPGKTRER